MIYKCHVNVDSKLTSYLKSRKKYIIKLMSENLDVKWWIYSNYNKFFNNNDEKFNYDFKVINLINNRLIISKVTFTIVKSLFWSLKIEIRMHFCTSFLFSDFALLNITSSSITVLKIFIINMSFNFVTVQMQKHQIFLISWNFF